MAAIIFCYGFFFSKPSTVVTARNSTKLCYVRKWAILYNTCPEFGSSLPLKRRPKLAYFWVVLWRHLWHHDLSANIFGTKVATDKRNKVYNCIVSPTYPRNLVNFDPQMANTNCMHSPWCAGAATRLQLPALL